MVKKVFVCFGTRPEAIKMAPVIMELKKHLHVIVCVTGQHNKMLYQVLKFFEIEPDIDLKIMKKNQDIFYITSQILLKLKDVFFEEKPDLVLVHGDTSTTLATSIASFYARIPLAHVEAGLRTNDINSPYPEEFNRIITSKVTSIHFSPTKSAKSNLIKEGIDEKKIIVTGNTVIDTLFLTLKKVNKIEFKRSLLKQVPILKMDKRKLPKIILITGHRRESFGEGFQNICNAIKQISILHKDIQIIYPVHLNPNVQNPVKMYLSELKNVHLIQPLEYHMFVKLMDLSYIILTDSGGIQEEAPSLGKPVLIMRNKTERPEVIKSGSAALVGTNPNKIVSYTNKLLENFSEYKKMSNTSNPFGNGKASIKIMQKILGLKL